MSEQAIDVNTESTSSNDSTNPGVEGQDVAASSSKAQPSPADLSKGFQDAIKEGLEASQATEKDSTLGKTTTAKSKEDVKTEDQKPKQKVEDKGPIPYERFVEVNTAKQQLEEKVKEQEDYVAAQRSIGEYCAKNNITNEDFSYWLNVAAAVKNNPEKALELLEPQFQQLKGFKGEVLSPELQSAVDNGEMSLEWAKKLAKSENQQKFSQNRVQLTEEQSRQQQQQRYMQEVQTSFQSWAKTKQQTDPDFQPKVSGAEDGKFEFMLHKMNAEYPNANIKSVDDLIAFAEKIYESVNKSFGRFAPHRNGTKVVKSNQSTSALRGESQSWNEAISMGARKAGVDFTPK